MNMEFLGIKFDELANQNVKGECSISSSDSKVNVLRIPTNEELVIALDTELIVTEQLSFKEAISIN
jgi:acetate kinase